MSTKSNNPERPDPEVTAKPTRRQFSAQYKLRILELADACQQAGAVGELLRREGLYFSHLTNWRQQRLDGTLQALQPQKRGPKKKAPNPLLEEVERLRRENERLQRDLSRATAIVEVQKKISELLGIELKRPESNESTC